jgi:hypothetical protein
MVRELPCVSTCYGAGIGPLELLQIPFVHPDRQIGHCLAHSASITKAPSQLEEPVYYTSRSPHANGLHLATTNNIVSL